MTTPKSLQLFLSSSRALQRLTSWYGCRTARPSTGRIAAQSESLDGRTLALTRCVLCAAVGIVMYVDPHEPARLPGITFLVLAGYGAYTFLVLFASRNAQGMRSRSGHWIDVGVYAILVAITGGASSIFFFLFFFSILLASFSYGYREGIAVTIFAVGSYLLVGFWNDLEQTGLSAERAVRVGGYLAFFGYIVAHWGEHEVLMKRQMRLLREVNGQWNPRFGVPHTIGVNIERLLTFYEADQCLLVMMDRGLTRKVMMFTASNKRPGGASEPIEISQQAASPFMSLGCDLAVAYERRARMWAKDRVRCIAYEGNVRVDSKAVLPVCERLEDYLDTPYYLSAPFTRRDGALGRVYISSKSRRFGTPELEFLLQFVATLTPVVENLVLMDELITRASEHERYKISRDIHDTTIQPYIGLKLGLQAVVREAASGGSVEEKLQDLIEMTDMTVKDLRAYAAQLRNEKSVHDESLITAVNEQADRYHRFYGVEIDRNMEIGKPLTGRLAAEVFLIITEGLNNIIKHTTAKRAFVAVSSEIEALHLKIGNEASPDRPAQPFVPKTINERAHVLGGSAYTELDEGGYTVVHVNIPLVL
jgi:signal transduction histidine kinase